MQTNVLYLRSLLPGDPPPLTPSLAKGRCPSCPSGSFGGPEGEERRLSVKMAFSRPVWWHTVLQKVRSRFTATFLRQCSGRFRTASHRSTGRSGIGGKQIQTDWELITDSFNRNRLQTRNDLLSTSPPGESAGTPPGKCVWNCIYSLFPLLSL